MIYELGKRLRDLRVLHHMSQKQVADRIGIARSAVSGYEHNTNQPPIDILVKFCSLYNVSADFILGLEKRKTIIVEGLTKEQINLLDEITNKIIEFRQI